MKKVLLPALMLTMLCMTVGPSFAQDGDATTEPASPTAAQVTQPSKREPIVAFALSFLIPGLGQFYNGDTTKGAIQLGGFAAGLALMIAGSATDDVYDDWNFDNPDETDVSTLATVGAITALGFWAWSAIDAPLSASKKNRANGFGHMVEIDDLGLDSARVGGAPGAKLAFHF